MQSPGGKGANEAVAVGRLGRRTALVGCLGNDEPGIAYRKYLEEFCRFVDISGVRGGRAAQLDSEPLDSEPKPTGTAVQIITNDVKFTVSCPEANKKVGKKEVEAVERLLKASTDDEQQQRGPLLLLQMELPLEPMLKAIEVAKKQEVPVAFKPSPLPETRVEEARQVLDAGVSICFANETEAPVLLGWDPSPSAKVPALHTLKQAEAAANAMLERWKALRAVVVTCDVAHVYCEREQLRGLRGLPPACPRLDRDLRLASCSSAHSLLVVPRTLHYYDKDGGVLGSDGDIVGAADAFIGGFIGAGLNDEVRSAGRSLLWAHAAGTLSTHTKGAQESQPVEEQVQSFLKRWGPNVDEAAGSDAMEVEGEEGEAAGRHHPLHTEAMRMNVDYLPNLLPSTKTLEPQTGRKLPEEVTKSLRDVRRQLGLVDAFGLRPSQRAYQCFQLLKGKDDSDSRVARASVRNLIVAELLLYPELVVRSATLAQGPGANLCSPQVVIKGATLEAHALADRQLFPKLRLPDSCAADASGITAWLQREKEDAACQLAALVTLSMLIEDPQHGSTTGRREHGLELATSRLLARCICILLHDDSNELGNAPTRTALIRARLQPSGSTLLLAAAHKGISAIVRALLATHHHLLDEDAKKATLRWPAEGGEGNEGGASVEGGEGDEDADDGPFTAIELALRGGPESEYHHKTCLILLDYNKECKCRYLDKSGQTARADTPKGKNPEGWRAWIEKFRNYSDPDRNLVIDGRYVVIGSAFEGSNHQVLECNDKTESKPAILKFTDEKSFKLEKKIYSTLNTEYPVAAPELKRTFEFKSAQENGSQPKAFKPKKAEHRHVLVLEPGDRHPLFSSVNARADVHGSNQRNVAFTVLRCVHAFHDLTGMVHRDIKPDNFLHVKGQFRLIDFDSACDDDTLTNEKDVFTPEYIAPELAFARADQTELLVTRALDVWACGLILHYVFTGENLFGDKQKQLPTLLKDAGDYVKIDEIVQKRLDEAWDNKTEMAKYAGAKELIRSMLVADPRKRGTLDKLLTKRFFQGGQTTHGLMEVRCLAIFCSPTHMANDGNQLTWEGGKRIVIDAEMSNIIKSIPFTARRETLPAASIREVRELIQGTGDPGSGGQPGLSPQILHFAGHGVNYEGNGYLAFVREDSKGRLVGHDVPPPGSAAKPDPEYFADADALIDILRSIHGKKRLKCIFLNACQVLDTLGKKLHDAYPDVTVIGFRTNVESRAAAAFARGFYKCIGDAIRNDESGSTPKDAYNAAVKAWEDAGFRVGNPNDVKINGDPAFTKADEGKFLGINAKFRGQAFVQAGPDLDWSSGKRPVRWADPDNLHPNSLGPSVQGFFKILSVEEHVGGLVKLIGNSGCEIPIDNPEKGLWQRDHGIFGIYEGKAVKE